MANKNKKSDNLVDSTDTDSTEEVEVKRVLRAMRDDGPEIEVDEQTFDIEDHDAGLDQYSRAELRALLTERETELENLRYQYEQIRNKRRGLDEELKARIEITDELNAQSVLTEERIGELTDKLDTETSDRKALRSELDISIEAIKDLETQLSEALQNLGETTQKFEAEADDRENLQSQLDKVSEDLDSEGKDRQSLQQRLDEAVKNAEHLKSQSISAETRLEEAEQKIIAEAEKREDLVQKFEAEAKERDNLAEQLDAAIKDGQNLQQRLDESVEHAEHLKTESQSAEARLDDTLQKLESEASERDDVAQRLAAEVTERSDLADKLASEVQEREKLQRKLDDSTSTAERLKDKSDGLVSSAKELKGKLRTLESDATKKDKNIASLEKRLKKLSKRENSSNKAALEKAKKALSQKLSTSRSEVAELKGYIDARKVEWTNLQAELQEATLQLEEKTQNLEHVSAELESRNTQLVRSREQYISASDELTSQKASVRKLRKQNRELDKSLHQDAMRELEETGKTVTEQAGQLEAQLHRIEALNADLEKSTSYADTLRMQLQDQIAVSKVSVAMREKLEAGLDAANTAINELTDKYHAETERADQIAALNESMQAKFDNEIRQVRFELGAAEETIAGQETLNEQLVSDLVDHRSFRQALETQLGEVEQESNDSVSGLNRELAKARRDAEDLERNLRNKDTVITELMQELAGRSDSIELKDESGNGLQKIDGFKAEVDEEEPLGDKDRVARQLIGNADGQELRFPLFKNRLTIGRTSNNDIQLNMQYISRRHAVISIDHNQTRVIDWGSKNGVFVNDTKVTEKILESGDIVTIGTTDFRYEERTKR
ncbi:MAG: FHA domain-containing protein [Woeseiaceae bacterium]